MNVLALRTYRTVYHVLYHLSFSNSFFCCFCFRYTRLIPPRILVLSPILHYLCTRTANRSRKHTTRSIDAASFAASFDSPSFIGRTLPSSPPRVPPLPLGGESCSSALAYRSYVVCTVVAPLDISSPYLETFAAIDALFLFIITVGVQQIPFGFNGRERVIVPSLILILLLA